MSRTRHTNLARLLYLVVTFSSLTAVTSGCADQPLTVTRQPAVLRIASADSCAVTIHDLATAYEELNPWVTIEVQTLNSAVALASLQAGAVDLAALSWIGESDPTLWTTPFAVDAVAVIVHPDVPLESIGLLELREVFRGRMGEWTDGTRIQVVSRESGSGVRDAFESAVMGGQDTTLTAVVMSDNTHVLEYVAATPGAIGYVSMGRRSSGVRVVAIAGVLPSISSIQTYPLTYPLLLATVSEPAGEVRPFLQWALQAEGQRIVASSFALPSSQE